MKTPSQETMASLEKKSGKLSKRLKLYDDIVLIVVGKKKRVFKMHKGLLCSVSDYFTAALEGAFKEASEQKIEFPEDPPWFFERFHHWLYSEQVLDGGESLSVLDFDRLETVHVFAESRCISKLQNHAVDLMIRKSAVNNMIPTPGGSSAYSDFAPSSPLRMLYVDMAVYYGAFDESWPLEDEPKDFLVDLLRGVGGCRNEFVEKDFWEARCDYHIHADGGPRCSGGSAED
ncbi:hypothetical protein MMC30_000667 [Trapelia coarctata]|nr:hypothetical protein [Trapelia coarctata]